MATIVFGGGITNIVGSHAGNTFARNKGGPYMKAKVHGLNPRSELQLVRRTTIGQLAKHYTNTLTDAQRAAWRTFAGTFPVINRIGNTAFLSAQQMFTKLNAQVLDSGNPIVALPPGTTAVGTPTVLTVTAVHGLAGHLDLNNTVVGATGNDKVWYWVSPPLNPGRNFVSSQLRRLPTQYAVNAAVSITSVYTNVFGAFPSAAGMRVIVRVQVVNTDTGIVSSLLQNTVLWT